jgi:hypothetical protein
MYCINTSCETKLMPFVGITVTQIMMELEKLATSNSKVSIPGRAVHTFHSALQTSTDILPVDFEAMVNKIFKYFHVYMVQVEELKEICDFIDVKYKQILGHVKSKWLSLQPTITRCIGMFQRLKSYFVSRKNAG